MELFIIAICFFIQSGGYPSAPKGMVDEDRETIAMSEDEALLESIMEENSLEEEDRFGK